MFEVIALGVGDAFSAEHVTSALLLRSEGFALAVDCPDTYRRVVREAAGRCGRPLDIADIDTVLITHVHGDHMNGLEGLAFYKHFAEGKRLRLATSPEVREVVWEQRLRASMSVLWNGRDFRELGFEDYFDYIPLSWTETTVIGPFRIRTRRTIHHVPTCALLVEAEGRIFGYSSDTAFDPGLIRFLSAADLIVHETNLGPAHTPYAELDALPGDVKKKMRLIHYPDGFEDAGSSIALLREGDVLEV